MIPLEEARTRVLADCGVLPAREEVLARALGLVLAEPVVASADVPPFANSAMDGFAVRAQDTAGAPVTLRVSGTLAAGGDPAGHTVAARQAVRIMTGAAMPGGADSVVMVERTSPGPADDSVVVEVVAARGDHVRAAGDDIRAGQHVFDPGTVLGPGHLGVLASLGLQAVAVRPAPRVGVLSTGDELIDGSVSLRPGQIRDSNRPTLLAMVREAGCAPVDLGVALDDPATIRSRMEEGLSRCEALVTSGGVSVGDFDHVKGVLGELGRMHWWQVAIKPAKPFAFGVADERGVPIFGLPGNPVSSMVSFEMFVRPALRQMAGHPQHSLLRPIVDAVAGEPLPRRRDGKLHLDRVSAEGAADGRYHVIPVRGQGSHMLRAMALSNALAMVPDGDGIAKGETVPTMLIGGSGVLGRTGPIVRIAQ